MAGASARALGIAISQGGEFAFVILGAAAGLRLVSRAAGLLIVVVTCLDGVTPLLFMLDERSSAPAGRRPSPSTTPAGRGQRRHHRRLRPLRPGRRAHPARQAHPFTALDAAPSRWTSCASFGTKIYYGDASQLDLLRAAGAAKAASWCSRSTTWSVRAHRADRARALPNLTVYARARNRKHAYRLMDLGVNIIRRETLLSSLDLARSVLMGLGLSKSDAESTVPRSTTTT